MGYGLVTIVTMVAVLRSDWEGAVALAQARARAVPEGYALELGEADAEVIAGVNALQ
jgi:hypothetical protein